MASHQVANGHTNGEGRDGRKAITVLVTGFGPFQERYPVNPSFEITKALPDVLPSRPGNGTEVRIIGYPNPIRVSYEEVGELVPKLHEAYLDTVDVVLHIGMASGRNYYTLERYAHRDGYNRSNDVDGKTLPLDDGLKRFGDCPAVMTTSLDYDATFEAWKSNVQDLPETSPAHNANCQQSTDAGRYLCDFIYFNSLAWFGRRNERIQGGKATARPVLFLHVPPHSDEKTLEMGQYVTRALIEAIADGLIAAATRNGAV